MKYKMGVLQLIIMLLMAGYVYSQCPRPVGLGVCAELCGRSCPSGKICCSNGCGHVCKTPVSRCPAGSTELANRNCGRGGRRCPRGYNCNIDRGDRFAVCCRDPDPCAKCRRGQKCKVDHVVCIRAPCPPIVTCTDPDTSVCSLPKVTGRCRASFRRWYYNSATKRCEPFIYGGCGGNSNNFITRKKCIDTLKVCRRYHRT